MSIEQININNLSYFIFDISTSNNANNYDKIH